MNDLVFTMADQLTSSFKANAKEIRLSVYLYTVAMMVGL